MIHNELIRRLQIDPGRRTLGELIQDREAGLHEIARLRREIERIRTRSNNRKEKAADLPTRSTPYRGGTLINVKEVCELLGISRSTVYKRVSDSSFPRPRSVQEQFAGPSMRSKLGGMHSDYSPAI